MYRRQIYFIPSIFIFISPIYDKWFMLFYFLDAEYKVYFGPLRIVIIQPFF